MKTILILTISVIMFSCGQEKKVNLETTYEGNVTTTISTDTSKLGRLIDLSTYTPTSVKFKYVLIDNSGQQQRISVPGPSDGNLEAVLYFDGTTFNRLSRDNLKLSTISKGKKESYYFAWLDSNIKSELDKTDSLQVDEPPTFFMANGLVKGGYFMLHNKILLRLYAD